MRVASGENFRFLINFFISGQERVKANMTTTIVVYITFLLC